MSDADLAVMLALARAIVLSTPYPRMSTEALERALAVTILELAERLHEQQEARPA